MAIHDATTSGEIVAQPPAQIRWGRWLALLALLGAAAWWLSRPAANTAGTASGRPAAPPAAVAVATARQGDMPVYLNGLGTVTAFNTVTVRSRVDGQITRIAFQEGQLVKEGDVLAEIDARPFQVQLTQAEGQLARDQAQLANAKANLARFQTLLGRNVVSKQEYDAQVATAGQFEGAITMDRGAIDAARLQLTYARITAPISGRAGLRQVDVGNLVHTTDQTGLVVITQVQPIATLFTIPADDLPPVIRKLNAGARLSVEAFDRSGQNLLATGVLLTADNQIDTATGTSKLKAVFDNQDGILFPNQFVNVRLKVDERANAVIAPVAGVQRGPQGTFVYAVKADQTVEVRPVTVGPSAGNDVQIETGLAVGETIVVDGVDKLRAGAPIQVRKPQAPGDGAAKPPGA